MVSDLPNEKGFQYATISCQFFTIAKMRLPSDTVIRTCPKCSMHLTKSSLCTPTNWMQTCGLLCYYRYFECETAEAISLWDSEPLQSHMNPGCDSHVPKVSGAFSTVLNFPELHATFQCQAWVQMCPRRKCCISVTYMGTWDQYPLFAKTL